MVVDGQHSRDPRTLLGLRPPAELADGPVPTASGRPEPAAPPAETPPRPAYNKVSSGWDSEDQEGRGKGSDLVTALRAVAVLVVVVGTIALLLR